MSKQKLWISVGIILVIAIIVIGIIMACFTTRSFEQVFHDSNLISYVNLVDSNKGGKEFAVTSKEKINQLLSILKQTKYKRVWLHENKKGWSYKISLCEGNFDQTISRYEIDAISSKHLKVNGKVYAVASPVYHQLENIIKEMISIS